ncbi:glycoside hydrolase family 3 protein [Streptococcus sp. S784/96/1]|uniref:glycoside hydrolase family 3 protein n=1 Tax=Streptococcus sp. S784/96/1 TaxID=2653499 RepID=UPI0013866B9E|nr:glycoside hydrolase family 3 protein [Streptococcus sp. S784/96/1]
MKKVYGYTTDEMSSLEIENRQLALTAAKEGIVLLKNEGALPLSKGNIALYGMGARKTVKGGTGSGEVQERYAVTIEEGLENHGFTITTKNWLDDYDREFLESRKAWKDMVEETIAGYANPMQGLSKARSMVYRYPVGRQITVDDITRSETDTAIYVIMRQAGENNDRKLEEGDFLLTVSEQDNLRFLAENYDKVVVIINVGGLIDVSFDTEISGVDAIIFMGQAGQEGGNALAKLLLGEANFSGKLAATWPLHYEDIPFSQEYSYLNDDLENEYYKEGIYVGYRYFDAFDKPVKYPFGYGLSYTTFKQSVTNLALDGQWLTMDLSVTNTGEIAGKQVVQFYLSCPRRGAHQEVKRLLAFHKTSELLPGQSETTTLCFDLSYGKVFDTTTASWLLLDGRYTLSIGENASAVYPIAQITLDETVTLMTGENKCLLQESFDQLAVSLPEIQVLDVPQLILSAREFLTEVVNYNHRDSISSESRDILDKLTLEEKISLVVGGDLQRNTSDIHVVSGAGGRSSLDLRQHGIPNIILSDGPAGINIVEHVRIQDNGLEKVTKVPEKYNFGAFAQMAKKMHVAETGLDVYRYATAWPVEMVLAQTWNSSLLEQVGCGIGKEMATFGITLWLAPGMNIQRNPLGGRHFEYLSEDPVLTGKLAAAITRGVQTIEGSGATIKHFACNNQEDNRNGVSSNIAEKALREIYLRGFEIVVKDSQPWAVMTSYNKINGIHTGNSRDLCTDILRYEWGFDGLVMTDWNACGGGGKGSAEQCVPAGNDLMMPGSPDMIESVKSSIAKGETTLEQLECCAGRVLDIILKSTITV